MSGSTGLRAQVPILLVQVLLTNVFVMTLLAPHRIVKDTMNVLTVRRQTVVLVQLMNRNVHCTMNVLSIPNTVLLALAPLALL